MEVTATIDVQQVLELVKKGLNPNLKVPLGEAAAYQVRSTSMNFIKERSPDGNPWAALSPKTLAQKKTNTILRETGAMVNATRYQVISDQSAVIENPDRKAPIHQKGAPSKNIPKREFLGFSDRDLREIEAIFDRYYQKLLNA
ncbi:MAG: phage virion morphogenesis protein [Iphinoe sp. HA4291-MV1]|nr:phage virion morphogenesis protein [Iphinoe sp. HA4291-MV1]